MDNYNPRNNYQKQQNYDADSVNQNNPWGREPVNNQDLFTQRNTNILAEKQKNSTIIIVASIVAFSIVCLCVTLLILNFSNKSYIETTQSTSDYVGNVVVITTDESVADEVIEVPDTTECSTTEIIPIITTTEKISVNNYPKQKGYKGSKYITAGAQFYNSEGNVRTIPRITIDSRPVYEFEKLMESDVRDITDKNNPDHIIEMSYLDYSSYQNGDVLSLLFHSGYDGHTRYRNINIDVTTGQALTPQEVAEKSGISMDYFNDEFNNYFFEHSEPSAYINEDGYLVIIYYSQTETGLSQQTKVLY